MAGASRRPSYFEDVMPLQPVARPLDPADDVEARHRRPVEDRVAVGQPPDVAEAGSPQHRRVAGARDHDAEPDGGGYVRACGDRRPRLLRPRRE